MWGGVGCRNPPPARPRSSTHPVPKIAAGKPSSPRGPMGAPVPVAWEGGGGFPKPPPPDGNGGGLGIKSPRSQGHGHVPRAGGAGAAVPSQSRGPRGASSPRRLGVPKPPPRATPNGCSASGSFCQSRAEPPPLAPNLPCCWGARGCPRLQGTPEPHLGGWGGRGQDEAVPGHPLGGERQPRAPPPAPQHLALNN